MAERYDHITCPHCGNEVPIINRLGRKPLSIAVKNISDALCTCRDISLAAQKLKCSRAYIYQELKKNGLTPREVIQKK